MPFQIVTIPCLQDNYAYLVHDLPTGATAVIDVPEAAPILRELHRRGWRASHILITHHHADHIDGVESLAAATGARVIGAEADARRLPALDQEVRPDDTIRIGLQAARVLDAPGHTIGHIAFYFPEPRALFTGDSLMVMGCGRLFEGTPEQMWDTLTRLAALPDATRIFSGHEYAATNARFALTVEPDNPDLISRAEAIDHARAAGGATVPATLAEERAANPFLRAGLPAMKAAVGMPEADDVAVFAELRRRRNDFRG